ncbi:uncharacterized protein K489DRAFT_383704 [Dissoconium aciculare CBS 342.82]|uniref:Secreted protein n=1 Tax=Dissoconium aciculare CBS 342.82 TaxID=1314786 RepID=A0A6J3LXX0_9PEZI|nr:uncharacterized protein K489DRAFT_383704 [Dissoconium aciculare CBS 342.82]KAF1819487.1 hypothetical protein K489DRAFT_383704 [Dissoconium aciculare CBS 342.82]
MSVHPKPSLLLLLLLLLLLFRRRRHLEERQRDPRRIFYPKKEKEDEAGIFRDAHISCRPRDTPLKTKNRGRWDRRRGWGVVVRCGRCGGILGRLWDMLFLSHVSRSLSMSLSLSVCVCVLRRRGVASETMPIPISWTNHVASL